MFKCHHRIRVAMLLLAALLPWSATAQSFDGEFEFRVTGIPVGTLVTRGGQSGSSYEITASIEPNRLIAAVTKYAFDGSAAGQVFAGKPVPVTYFAESTSPRASRETRITWKDGVPVSASVIPARSTAPDPASQAGTLDPVSAGFALLRDAPLDRICRTSIDIFDGSRRNRIVLGSPEKVGDEYICGGRYKRLEGEENTFSVKGDYGFTVVFRQTDNGLARFQRLESRTSFGNAVLERI